MKQNTHPNSNDFPKGDKDVAEYWKKPIYVITPKGYIKIYNPHLNASIKVGQMKSVKYLSDADYSYYRKKLRLVWANHFNSRGVCKDDFAVK